MKSLIVFTTLAITILAHTRDFAIKLRHDGPTVMGGRINFIAKLYEKKELAEGSFRFDWEDNTYAHNSASHTSHTPVDVWSVSYRPEDVPLPGKYVTTVTVHKKYNGIYTPVARLQIRFEIKGTSAKGKKPHPVVSQSWMDYKRDKILNSQAHALRNIQDPRIKAIVANRIDLINQRIPVMSASPLPQNKGEKLENKFDSVHDIINYRRQQMLNSQQQELDHIWNPQVKSIVYDRIDRINSKIPIMQPLESNVAKTTKINSDIVDSLPVKDDLISDDNTKVLDQDRVTTLDATNKLMKIDELGDMDNSVVGNVQESTVKRDTLDEVNNMKKKVDDVTTNFLKDSDAVSKKIEKHDKKIKELKEVEKSVVDSVQDPIVKEAVVGRIKEENKRVPYLSSADDVTDRFSGALNAIHERMDEIKKSQKTVLDSINDAVLREEALKQIEDENKLLESKGKELDAQLTGALDTIHQKMTELKAIEAETLNEVNDPVMKENVLMKLHTQNNKVGSLLDDVPEVQYPTPLEEVSQKIGDLEFAEWAAIESINDPIVRDIILQHLNEHNQQIPMLLNSSDDDAELVKSVDEVHAKISADVEKATRGLDDPLIEAVIAGGTTTEKTITPEKSKEINTNLTTSLTEVRNKLSSLKKYEKNIVDNTVGSEKQEVLDTVEEHNKQIPCLLLPSAVEANFTKALDKLNGRIANMTKFADMATTNITNPFVLSILQAKMALVNYKLISKYNQIKDNFTALLDKMATESGDESTETTTAKVPKLMLGPGMTYPQISDIIAQKMAMKTAPLAVMPPGITDPLVQNAILDKIAARNKFIQAKTDLIGSNIATAMALIRAKISALQGLEDGAVEDITDPSVKETVQASIDEQNKKVPLLLLPYGIESNFTKALNDFQTRINSIKDSFMVTANNITIPAIRSIVMSKFDFVNQLLKNKYDQLDSNFTAIMSNIQNRFATTSDKLSTEGDDNTRKVPLLTKTMGTTPTFDLTQISDLIRNKMANKFAFATNAMAGIKNSTIRAIVTDKLNEKSKNMSAIADKIAANFTNIMEAINNKTEELQGMEMLTLDSVDDPEQQAVVLEQIEAENRKIPSLTLSKRSAKKKNDDDDEDDVVPEKPNTFRFKYPFVVRF